MPPLQELPCWTRCLCYTLCLMPCILSRPLPCTHLQVAEGRTPPSQEYPELPASWPRDARQDRDMWAAWVEAQVVGRQFHRGSGDAHFVSVPTYPKFEGLSLQVGSWAAAAEFASRKLLALW